MGKHLATFVALAIFGINTAQAEEYLVKYRNENAIHKMASMEKSAFGFRIKDIHQPGRLLKVDIPTSFKSAVAQTLLADQNIEYIVPNTELRIGQSFLPEISLKKQYALTKTNAEKAWLRSGNKGSRGIKLAVIDTGVDYNHKNLLGNMINGYDFIANDNDPMDETMMNGNRGHGTHCAGIVGATGLVEKGIIGISSQVSIMPLRVFNARGSGTIDNAIKAIDYAIAQKVQVISASWSAKVSPANARPLLEALQRAGNAGIIFVAAASNDSFNNDKNDVYPANADMPHVITVAASTTSDGRASYSNYGKAKVSLAAPGDKIISTVPRNNYEEMSGTSMATPFVAGLVALLKAQDPTLNGAQAKALLQSTGAKVGIETACKCRVDAFAAMETLLSKKPWLVPASGTVTVGKTLKFTTKNNNGFVKYISSKPELATIDEKTGLLTAIKKGTVTITATDERGNIAKSTEIYIIK